MRHWLWRAVDQTGIVLDVLVQRLRNKQAAERLLRKLLKRQMRPPRVMITDKLVSYGAANSPQCPLPVACIRLTRPGKLTVPGPASAVAGEAPGTASPAPAYAERGGDEDATSIAFELPRRFLNHGRDTAAPLSRLDC